MKLFIALAFVCELAFAEEQVDEPANRAIILPGSTYNRNALCQWQVASNPCLNNPYGALNFPHPSDNAKFLQCGLNARLYIVQCPAGELYDQATATCITAKQVAPQITWLGSIGRANPCTVHAMNAGQMYFPVDTNSQQFIQCDAAGIARVLTCPSNLVWDQSRASCVYSLQNGVVNPAIVMTGTGSVPGANPCTAQAISTRSLYFSHPDPTKFIQCDLVGNAFVQSCPSGLVWNQYSETCASQLASLIPNTTG